MPSEATYRLQKLSALISLIVGFAMLAMKTTAYFITHSAAIFSDAIESVVHVAATAMAFYSVILSARPADESHPYGHGKVEFFSAGIEGALIVLAAVAIIYEAIRGMIFGRELAQLDTGMIIILVASVVNLVLGWYLIRQGKATGSLTLVADGKHVLTDSWTSFGVVAGLVLVLMTDIQILDPIVAIIVALNILVSGYQLMRVSVGGLMDESDQETLDRVVEVVNESRTSEWITTHHLRVRRSGALHHIDFHLTIPFYWDIEHGHAFQHDVEKKIVASLQNHAQVLIHLDPCTPSCCSMCSVDSCPKRSSAFTAPPAWDVPALIGKPPYTS